MRRLLSIIKDPRLCGNIVAVNATEVDASVLYRNLKTKVYNVEVRGRKLMN